MARTTADAQQVNLLKLRYSMLSLIVMRELPGGGHLGTHAESVGGREDKPWNLRNLAADLVARYFARTLPLPATT